ncbi:MAG: class III extradiol ring-cleavage dioxygenase [Arenicellales bacterium]|nr:class III extradiol ring-cleavage dioxygenase [Arenicellales bacterium]
MTSATILYFPHGGGPLPLLNDPGHARLNHFLRRYPDTIAKPDAIVVISAHWEEPVITISAAQSPTLLFDYYGFPPETYEYQYPASGHPQLAERVHTMLRQAEIDSTLDHARGFDHGVFVPLLLMYPDADIPCIQVSLSSSLDAGLHIRIGRALNGLKNDNLLVLGSGFSFHNMQVLMGKRGEAIDDRNREFEAWLARTCSDNSLSETEREQLLTRWELAPHARYCHPREEHLLPLHVCYGIAQQSATLVFQNQVSGFIASAYQWNQ